VDSRSITVIVVLFVVAAAAVYFYVPSIRDFLRKRNSASWPSIDATVQRGQVGTGPTSAVLVYRSVFGYVYSVDSKRHVGVFLFLLRSEEKARELQRKLDGARIQIGYDPKCPETSVVQSLTLEFADLVVNQDPQWTNYAGHEVIDLNLQ
jgi:hypothetical protein